MESARYPRRYQDESTQSQSRGERKKSALDLRREPRDDRNPEREQFLASEQGRAMAILARKFLKL